MPPVQYPNHTTPLARDVAEVLKRSGLPFVEQVAAFACIELLVQHWGDEHMRPIVQEFALRYGVGASAVMIDNYVVNKP